MSLYLSFLALIWIGLITINLSKRSNTIVIKGSKALPRVLVIMPCKGRDIMLQSGINSIKKQDYLGHYEIVAVADSPSDPSINDIKRTGIRYIIRRKMNTGGSNKVMALSTALQEFKNYDIYVVADSDIRCRPDWLRLLVEPLKDRRIGVSTAYPYFKPVRGSGFWAKVKMAWGFVGNGLMESDRTKFAWGGSMAFRKDLLDKKSLSKFRNSISDDISITKMVKGKGLGIYYLNKRVIEVPSNDDFKKFSEWATRQTALSIRGYKSNFSYGLTFYSANLLLMVSGTILTIFFNVLCIFFLVPFAIRIAKTYRRAEPGDRTVSLGFVCLFMDLIYISNLMVARFKKEIAWRGITYKLASI